MSDAKTFTPEELEAAIAAAKEAQDQKNRELLAEIRDLKNKLRSHQEITPDALAAVEAERDKLQAELAEATKALKTANTEREKAVKALEAESGFTHKLLVENGLREALAANGVTNPVHQKAAMALLSPGVQVYAEGDTRIAKSGDKALADAIKEWASGDEGKHFVAAPLNGGGGAPGSNGQPPAGAKVIPRAQFDAMSHAERSSFSTGGGKVVDAA